MDQHGRDDAVGREVKVEARWRSRRMRRVGGVGGGGLVSLGVVGFWDTNLWAL